MAHTTFNLQDIINLLPPLDGYELKLYVDSLQAEIVRLMGIIEAQHTIGDVLDIGDCLMCDKGKPPRKAVTVIADIPACDQCAKEYQDAEDALGNEAHE